MEKFSIKKLFDLSPIGFYKVFGLGIKVVIIIVMVLGLLWVKNLLFPPAPANVNAPEITVSEGGNVVYTVHQGEPKRKWWMPTPGVGIRGGQRTGEDSPFAEVFGELKWEF